jgi:hypothetical protein
VSRDFFASGFFHQSSSPKPPKITLGSVRKFMEIFTNQGAPSGGKFDAMSTTPAVNFLPLVSLLSTIPSLTPVATCRYQRHGAVNLAPVSVDAGAQ